LRRSIIMAHLHDWLAGYLVLRRAGKVQEVPYGRIIEALRAHDVAAARQLMLDELNETRDAILERAMQEDGALWHIGAAK
jgi:DNA-binding GntR family transcriptional regulator